MRNNPSDLLRFEMVDALRGLAMLWMTVFHVCFDLNHFGYWRQDFYTDPFWTWQRTAIVSLFLFCAGLGQAIAVEQGQGWARFGRRWLQLQLPAPGRALARLGRWSLSYYLLHQPVLIGLLMLAAWA